MWDISNSTPFACDRAVLRDRNGAETWVVVVKGTFEIHDDGTTSVAGKQLDVFHAAKFRGDPGNSSMLYDLDMVPLKPTTDVLLNGCAYTVRGRDRRSVEVSLSVGSINKTIRVTGDRVWERRLSGVSATEPQSFDKLPIVYERAFGGRDPEAADPERWPCERRNPIGVGYASKLDYLIGTPLPNAEQPSHPINAWNDRPTPAGFTALPPNWMPRASFAGTYDDRWMEERFPLVPDDFDDRFLQCAPLDQQAPLRGGEKVELRNLTPDGLLQFRLPSVALGLRTLIGGTVLDHRSSLHTVVIEPEYPRVIMSWHSAVNCHKRSLKVERTSVWLKPRITLAERPQ
jgi:hypothetical protein